MISLISNGASVAFEALKYVVPTSFLGTAALVLSVAYVAFQKDPEPREGYHPLSAMTVAPKVYVLKNGPFNVRY